MFINYNICLFCNLWDYDEMLLKGEMKLGIGVVKVMVKKYRWYFGGIVLVMVVFCIYLLDFLKVLKIYIVFE